MNTADPSTHSRADISHDDPSGAIADSPAESQAESQADSPAGSLAATRSFTLWALETLRLKVEREDEYVYRFFAPEERRGSLNGAGSVRFTFADAAAGGATRAVGPVERVTPQSRMFQWILDELQTHPRPLQALARDDVAGVEQLEEPLRAAYALQGVTLHLVETQLEPRPVLRLAVRQPSPSPKDSPEDSPRGSTETRPRLRHWHFLPDGSLLDDQLAWEMGLDQPQSANGSSPAYQGDLEAWLESAVETLRQRNPEPSAGQMEFVASCLVWCRYVSGKLLFACRDRTVEVPFAGWARRFRSGCEQPPPFHCPATGRDSYHVEASDDGQITVAEALETCGFSGRRVLAGGLEACQATGQRVLPEYLVTCPVSGRRLLADRLVECRDCRQAVDPDNLEQGRCGACRKMATVSKDDPRMALVLGEYPKLERWSRWRMSETGSVYVLTANDWFRRMLVVLQKESLEVRHLATAGRLRPAWLEVPLQQRAEFFS